MNILRFIRLLVEEQLAYLQFVVIMRKAAINICIQVFCGHTFSFLWDKFRSEIAGSHGKCMVNFIRKVPLGSNV